MCASSSHEFNEEGFDSRWPDYRGGRARRIITTTERQRSVAVAGACPDTQGVPLTRWSLERLSAWLAEHEAQISAGHLGSLLADARLSFRRTRSWKASPDPDNGSRAARAPDLNDEMGPISLKPIHVIGWAARGRPERLRTTYDRKHGIRYIFGRLDIHCDRLSARMRPAAPTRAHRGHKSRGAPRFRTANHR